MKISIIIVSWNVKKLLKKCLKSVYNNQGGLDLEIFVIDNNSNDGSREMIKKEFSKVVLIANKKNLGFAQANNQGIKKTKGEYILVLNPDTEIFSNTLKKSVEFMEQNKNCGIMGAQLLNSDKTVQPSVRRFPKVWPIFLMLIKLPKLFPNLKSVNKYLAVDFDYSRQQEADQVMGAYMFIRKAMLDKIGLFDERFFIWFEEVDLCRRFWQAGYKVIYNPTAKAIHHGGQSFARQRVINKQWRFFQSALKYFFKT